VFPSSPRNRTAINIWPGFVDALATLLLVFIFMLVVFVLAHFHLSDALSSRDAALQEFRDRVTELIDTLAQERRQSHALRQTITGLTSQIEDARTQRDDLQARLDQATEQATQATQELLNLQAAYDEALLTIEANKETLELRLQEIASLREDMMTLRTVRDELEAQVGRLATELEEREGEVGEERDRRKALEAQLAKAEEQTRLAQQEIEARDIRLQELLDRLTREQETLAGLSDQLAATLAQRDELQARLEQASEQAVQADQAMERLQAALNEAQLTIKTDRETLELRLRELASLREDLIALRTLRDELEAQVGRLATELEEREGETGAERDRRKALEAQLAKAEEQTRLVQEEIESRDIRLQELINRFSSLENTLAKERGLRTEVQSQIEQLDRYILALREHNDRLSRELRLSEARVQDQKEQITELEYRLSLELIHKVQELSRYRSEFFGRLREVLGDHPDIRIVGDRFLFQSELLFATGSAVLGEAGRHQLARVADTLREIAQGIPADINWILQVNGHTDRRPIRTAEFRSNWELSMARAISIVRFLIERGIPPDRLAAAGFAEFQPIDPADSELAYSRNRRIELKLTSR